jgi:hypothetical protein
VKVCPRCGFRCEDAWKFCPKDGTDLAALIKGTNPIVLTKLCPRCGVKYDSRVRFCLKDGEALVSGTPR